jgi:sphingolipid delta-4 desaturase
MTMTHKQDPLPSSGRAKAILQQHPEIRGLIGPNPFTLLCIVGLIALQLGIAIVVNHQPLWLGVVLACFVGSLLALGLYLLIHECSHHLVFRRRPLNRLAGILANSVNVIPYSVLYQGPHLKHHTHPGDPRVDPDVPSEWEAKLIGNGPVRKFLWLLLYPLFQALRGARLTGTKSPTGWLTLNVAFVLAVDLGVLLVLGPKALLYLFLSYFFAMGLPFAGCWIPDHYGTQGQETYSNYGWFNLLLFNRGYHTEHHDFPSIPWNRLPRLRRLAPEWYDTLAHHRTCTGSLVGFLFNRDLSLRSRVATER